MLTHFCLTGTAGLLNIQRVRFSIIINIISFFDLCLLIMCSSLILKYIIIVNIKTSSTGPSGKNEVVCEKKRFSFAFGKNDVVYKLRLLLKLLDVYKLRLQTQLRETTNG